MKLKEKLADEAATQSGIESRTGRINYRNGFEAGFEEAIEMSIVTALNRRHSLSPVSSATDLGGNLMAEAIAKAIKDLGKEEVKMSEQTIKCPICGEPYVFYMYMAGDQSACPDCRRKARTKK